MAQGLTFQGFGASGIIGITWLAWLVASGLGLELANVPLVLAVIFTLFYGFLGIVGIIKRLDR